MGLSLQNLSFNGWYMDYLLEHYVRKVNKYEVLLDA